MANRKLFSKFEPDQVEAPNLAQVQFDSYQWFLDEGLPELLKEISPVKDWTEKEFELNFLSYILEKPKFDENIAREKNITHEAPLRIRVELKNKRTGKTSEQELYLGDFPLMTPRGTFIINCVERVVISQLIRSPGAYFTGLVYRGKKLFGAKVIPNRGAWLELDTEPDGLIGVKIDRRRKVPVTDLLRAFASMEGKDFVSNEFI